MDIMKYQSYSLNQEEELVEDNKHGFRNNSQTNSEEAIIDKLSSKNVSVLKEYEKRVVDLSRRNRLLKYPKRARAISFTIGPNDFFSRFGDAENLKIPFVHKDILGAEAAEKKNQLSLDESDHDNLEEPDSFFESFTDIKGEKLLNTLQALRLDTKRKYEEHGLHVLYVTVGNVSWKDPQVGKNGSNKVVDEYDYSAPIFLIPVAIKEQKLPQKMTSIHTALDFGDIVVNPVLRLLITEQYNAREISVPEDITNISDILQQVQKEIKQVFSEVNIQCDCFDAIKLGQFSFYGQQIYEDLKKNEEAILSSDFIKGLCGDGQIVQEGLSISAGNPDHLLSVKEDFSVLDADASQLKVIEKSINGNHLVIQGPPGTGKSQTIVNLISNLLARNKTILVVCEKQVALEVVYDRLKRSGLDKLCLPLFSQKQDKSTFARNILSDVSQIIRNETAIKADRDNKLSDRENYVKKLRDYAEALQENIDSFGKNTFWVHGKLSSVQSLNKDSFPVIWEGDDPLKLTHGEYKSLCNLMKCLEPYFNRSSPNFSVNYVPQDQPLD